jgi:para-nitrobenzyl esterase
MLHPGSSRTVGDEDCLALNIWTSSVDSNAKLPVLVFIHGGAHMSGSSSGADSTGYPWYFGSNIAKKGPAVLVTIAYRVGALGFIAHRGLSRQSGYGGSGDYGHMDQIRALEWVRDNIAHFGGDPEKVMIFGQSGGATSVLVLLASPRARGLFHAAIMHSMAAFTFSLPDAEQKGALVEKGLGCTNGDPDKAIDCMRRKSAHKVTTSVSNDLTMSGSGVIFGPSVDGYVLPATIMDLLRSGRQNQAPVIVGTTADEFTTMVPLMLPRELKTEGDYKSAIASYFSSVSSAVPSDAIYGAYKSGGYQSTKDAMIALVSDYVYTCPARMVTRALSASSNDAVRRFIYTHVFTSPGWGQFKAAHGFELALLFGPLPEQLALHFDAGEQALSGEMIRAWAGFAQSGSPVSGFAEWPVYDSDLDNYLALDTPPHAGAAFRKEQCDFWQQYESGLYP